MQSIKALFKKDFEDRDKLHLTHTNLFKIYKDDTLLSAHKCVKNFNSINELLGCDNYNDIIYLKISDCNLFELPILPENLYELDCSNNNIYSLSILPYNLRYLKCSHNNLYKLLDHFPSYLTHIDCSTNNLFKINNLPNKLRYLLCKNNNITFLPKIPNTLYVIDIDDGWTMNSPIGKKMEKVFGKIRIFSYSHGYGGYDNYDDGDGELNHRDTFVNWYRAYEFSQKRHVKRIENWYMDCKYNPVYKKCRERIEKEFEEMYSD